MRWARVAMLGFCLSAVASASTLTQPQIEKALTDLEMCIRTMCIPANDASMSTQWARDLRAKLAVQPNTLDQWTLGRLDPIILLLTQKQMQPALVRTQATIAALVSPAVLKKLGVLEHCVRTMCLPSGDAGMGLGYITTLNREMAQYPGALGTFVTRRLNAAGLLLKDKKLKEGLAAIQATIKEFPSF